jgi:hypothetical protein
VQRCKPMLTLNKAGPVAGYLLYPFDSFSLVVIVAIPWWVHNCNDRSPALGGKRCMVSFFASVFFWENWSLSWCCYLALFGFFAYIIGSDCL